MCLSLMYWVEHMVVKVGGADDCWGYVWCTGWNTWLSKWEEQVTVVVISEVLDGTHGCQKWEVQVTVVVISYVLGGTHGCQSGRCR